MRTILGSVVVLAASTWVACGGGGGGTTGPGPVATPSTGLASGTSLQVVSGEGQAPVAEAMVTISGHVYTTDSSGRITLADATGFGSLVDVVADGFLDRQTVLRRDAGTQLVLWPRTSPTGLDEFFTQTIVYTSGDYDSPDLAAAPLRRLVQGASEVAVVVSEEILADDGGLQRHLDAVDEINFWLSGRVHYTVTSVTPTSGVVFQARIDTEDAGCQDRILGLFRASVNGRGEITGGDIIYCDPRVARQATVPHELGHSLGLRHSVGTRDLMTPYSTHYRSEVFSEREGLVIDLLFDRPAGNRFPDNDRDVAVASAGHFEIRCR